MAGKANEEKREFARVLYMTGEQQKIIAEKVGVSEQTIGRWVKEGEWDKRRAAQNITRPEIVNNLLRAISNLVENLNEVTDPAQLSGAADKLAKLAATVEKQGGEERFVVSPNLVKGFCKMLKQQLVRHKFLHIEGIGVFAGELFTVFFPAEHIRLNGAADIPEFAGIASN